MAVPDRWTPDPVTPRPDRHGAQRHRGDVGTGWALFARPPASNRRALATPPVLESWNRSDHPDQIRLRGYLDGVDALTRDVTRSCPGTLAVELVVGLPVTATLDTGGRDLDNYLLPIIRRLGATRVAAVFGRKVHAAVSTIAVSPATLMSQPAGEPQLRVRTTGSATAVAWKQQIHTACAHQVPRPLPPGPVRLRLRFGVSTRRNWSTLWKPAIDALGPLLCVRNPAAPYHPDDDRITDLELHRTIDDRLGDHVTVDGWWQPA
jgi:hypothetical protein